MSYVIELYGTAGGSTVQDLLPSPVITVRGWSKRINAPGRLVFTMHKHHPSATDENLKMWRHVRLYRMPRDGSGDPEAVWYGILLSKREVGDRIEVVCDGALKLFTKRLTAEDEAFEDKGSEVAFGLLDDTNLNDGDTGITAGDGQPDSPFTADAGADTLTRASHGLLEDDVIRVVNQGGSLPGGLSAATNYYVVFTTENTFQVSTSEGGAPVNITSAGTGTHSYYLVRSLQATGRMTIFRMWEEMAMANAAEFEIDDAAAFNFVPSLGTDRSETVELIFRRDGQPGSNLLAIEIAEEGEPMVNRVFGKSSAGGEYQWNDTDSQAEFGVLAEEKQFRFAQDVSTVAAVTAAYGRQRALPIPDFQAMPAGEVKKLNPITGVREISGLQYGDVQVGDLVLVTVVTANRNVSVVKRIAELIVDVDENLNERMRFTFTEAGVFVTGQYLDSTDYQDVKRRLAFVESQL